MFTETTCAISLHLVCSGFSAALVEQADVGDDHVALDAGIFAENINTRGIELRTLPVGTRLRVGETELEVTQIGKQCHNDCEIKRATGKCVMPTEGIFAVVVKEGRVQAGDEIEVLK